LTTTKISMFFALLFLSGLFNTPSGYAQSQTESKRSFEVASVKIAKTCGNTFPDGVKILGTTRYFPGGRYITCNLLRYILMDVYRLDPASPPTGGPNWIDDTLLKIEAKAEGNPSKEDMRLMIQSLFEERLKLKVHPKMQEAKAYSLVVMKNGSKFQPAKDAQGNPVASISSEEERKTKWEEMQTAKLYRGSLAPGAYAIAGTPGGQQLYIGRAISMETFAASLFSIAGRKVVDKTGLAGLYDVKIEYANPLGQQLSSPGSAAELPADIFTAIQEQLGLRLEPDKAPLEQLIIDSVEKPSEN
jgi:uncharacterized protein (TIGR03435 family)